MGRRWIIKIEKKAIYNVTIKRNVDVLLNACKGIGLATNTMKTKSKFMEVERMEKWKHLNI